MKTPVENIENLAKILAGWAAAKEGARAGIKLVTAKYTEPRAMGMMSARCTGTVA